MRAQPCCSVLLIQFKPPLLANPPDPNKLRLCKSFLERWGEPAISAQVCQLQLPAPWCATISWIACLLASAEGPLLHSLSPCQSSQVNWPQTLRGNYCTCSWSLSSINGEKMTSCARVYWICHFNSWISYPRLCFIAFQMKFNYPVPSHFQFSGRDGSGTWKKVRDGSGTGIPSDPEHVLRVTEEDQDKISCIWLLMPPYPPPPQIKSSLWRPLVVVMEHYPKKKEVSRLISYVWCDIVQALNLKYIKISGS